MNQILMNGLIIKLGDDVSAKSGEIGHQIRNKLDTESGFYWTPASAKFTLPNHFIKVSSWN